MLALGLAAFAGSALAGNGHGNDNGASQGNSANAPGQEKKDDRGSVSDASAQGGADANASVAQSGVKPTSSTAKGNHNTSCKTGGGSGSSATCTSSGSSAATAQTAAHADSKRYGNGTTAAQIANSRGAPTGTTVYGPGNSQPHKVTDCKHRHAVDVHAVKSYSSASCTTQTTGSTSTKTHTGSHASTSTAATTAGTSATGSTSAPNGGVLGATASAGAPQGGVLGAIESVGQGTLPFTGFPLRLAFGAAIVLIALGLTLRRHAGTTA